MTDLSEREEITRMYAESRVDIRAEALRLVEADPGRYSTRHLRRALRARWPQETSWDIVNELLTEDVLELRFEARRRGPRLRLHPGPRARVRTRAELASESGGHGTLPRPVEPRPTDGARVLRIKTW